MQTNARTRRILGRALKLAGLSLVPAAALCMELGEVGGYKSLESLGYLLGYPYFIGLALLHE